MPRGCKTLIFAVTEKLNVERFFHWCFKASNLHWSHNSSNTVFGPIDVFKASHFKNVKNHYKFLSIQFTWQHIFPLFQSIKIFLVNHTCRDVQSSHKVSTVLKFKQSSANLQKSFAQNRDLELVRNFLL